MRSIQSLGVTLVILALAGSASAQPSTDPSAVQAGHYRVEPQHTRVLFKVSHMGFTNWYGDFSGVTGTAVLDPRNPAADRLDVTVPVGSLSTTNASLDAELKTGGWLDAGKYPMARFVSRQVTPTGLGKADVTGDLTLHGVTRPLSLHVSFNGAGMNPMNRSYTAGFEAHGVFQRSAFGVSKYAPMVGDQVELIISGAFEKTAG